MARKRPPRRSTLPREQAKRRYMELGEVATLKQIREDSKALDRHALPIGPFGRLDAAAVAGEDGKTRGVISNLFGSQAAFQAATMELALNAGEWIDQIEYPEPRDFQTADEWVDALFASESARGPRHGADPAVDYSFLWALWLSVLPYGIWSEQVSRPSRAEQVQWIERLERVLGDALDHFGVALRDGITVNDLASAIASLVEGVWLSQCLTVEHPSEPSRPIDDLLRSSGRLLWLGATVP